MLFNSLEFALFFPAVTALYFLLRGRARLWLLLVASCVFYMAFVPKYLLILIVTIAVDYFAGLEIARKPKGSRARKLVLAASIVANVGMLGLFKYYNFIAATATEVGRFLGLGAWSFPVLNWVLPIGLSFHTFQAMAYTIEVYRGNQKPERDWLVYSLYVLFYPQLVAGPIERPGNLLPQLHREHELAPSEFVAGLRQMLWGFFKKVVIADRLTVLVDAYYSGPGAFPGWVALFAMTAFSFQIYCDFSGYTDIAIGAARLMGFRLMVNFDRPYLSRSVTEFWRRWHISLSSWFRDYLYVPLGGSRVPQWRAYLNLLAVFLVSGLWHGANWTFVIWGGLHGIYVMGEKALGVGERKGRTAAAVTFVLVTLAWVFFRAPSLSSAWAVYASVVRGWSPSAVVGGARLLCDQGFSPLDGLISIASCAFLLFVESKGAWETRIDQAKLPLRLATYYAGIAAVLLLGKFTAEQFIYFQF